MSSNAEAVSGRTLMNTARSLHEMARDVSVKISTIVDRLDAAQATEQQLAELRSASNKLRLAKVLLGRRFDQDIPLSNSEFDLLLSLEVARLSEQVLTVTELAEFARVPLSTAIRHIAKLEAKGLVKRQIDHQDTRRSLIQPLPEGQKIVDRHLGALVDILA